MYFFFYFLIVSYAQLSLGVTYSSRDKFDIVGEHVEPTCNCKFNKFITQGYHLEVGDWENIEEASVYAKYFLINSKEKLSNSSYLPSFVDLPDGLYLPPARPDKENIIKNHSFEIGMRYYHSTNYNYFPAVNSVITPFTSVGVRLGVMHDRKK